MIELASETVHNKAIYSWTDGVPVESGALGQLLNSASLTSILGPHIAVMPDVHFGLGATVGSVIPTINALIPAAVGVDIGCGMCAMKLNIKSDDLFDLPGLRHSIERSVPVGFSEHKDERIPKTTDSYWPDLNNRWNDFRDNIQNKKGEIPSTKKAHLQLGTLGGGNHFIEICEDQDNDIWIMLHSGSRGIGNRIGQHFIGLAKRDMEDLGIRLPDKDLAYLDTASPHYNEYVTAVSWAQEYAWANRRVMLDEVLSAVSFHFAKKKIAVDVKHGIIQCHHNYISQETHFGEDLWITRKGAVRARKGELVIIPGSMGTKSYIARGRGDPLSFESCSHGAGRVMSRGAAKRAFTMEDVEKQTLGVECRKDSGIIDELPGAYKDVESVMRAQADLVEIVHTLKQVLCVKG